MLVGQLLATCCAGSVSHPLVPGICKSLEADPAGWLPVGLAAVVCASKLRQQLLEHILLIMP
jgi:hypothetical protein